MEQHNDILKKLTDDTWREQRNDGFNSRELRLEILRQLADLQLPSHPGKEKIIQKQFLLTASLVGKAVLRQLLQENLLIPDDDYNYRMIMSGGEKIGADIAKKYGRILHQMCNEKSPAPEIGIPLNCQFDAARYQKCYDLNLVIPPGRKILYEISERYIEKFIAETVAKVDTAHGLWPQFIKGELPVPPVRDIIGDHTISAPVQPEKRCEIPKPVAIPPPQKKKESPPLEK